MSKENIDVKNKSYIFGHIYSVIEKMEIQPFCITLDLTCKILNDICLQTVYGITVAGLELNLQKGDLKIQLNYVDHYTGYINIVNFTFDEGFIPCELNDNMLSSIFTKIRITTEQVEDFFGLLFRRSNLIFDAIYQEILLSNYINLKIKTC